MGSARQLGKSLGRLWKYVNRPGKYVDSRPDVRPGCEFGLVVNERLRDMSEDLAAVRSLLRWLLLAVIGALVGLVADLVGAI